MAARALEGLRVVECGLWRAAPTIGQDNDYVCGELLGMSGQQIADLMERKVIY